MGRIGQTNACMVLEGKALNHFYILKVVLSLEEELLKIHRARVDVGLKLYNSFRLKEQLTTIAV